MAWACPLWLSPPSPGRRVDIRTVGLLRPSSDFIAAPCEPPGEAGPAPWGTPGREPHDREPPRGHTGP